MDKEEYLHITKLAIDYFIESSSSTHLIAALALLISFLGVIFSILSIRWSIRESRNKFLSEGWNRILEHCVSNPKFLDKNSTDDFWKHLNKQEQLQYDAFCYQLWDLEHFYLSIYNNVYSTLSR